MKKRVLMIALALLTLGLLSVKISPISAPPTSPYIAVVPSPSDPIMINWDFTVSISTDYYNETQDVWGWNVLLTFNPAVLEVIEVANGDLITTAKDSSATFVSHINNTIGEVSTGAFFYYAQPATPYTTNGPGVLVSITFRGVGTGYSNITLEKETLLQRYDPWTTPEVYNIVDAYIQPDNVGHGTVMVTIPGDVTYDKTVDVFDILKIKYHRSGPPPGPGGFNPSVDVNQDGSIDVFDILVAKAHLGESW